MSYRRDDVGEASNPGPGSSAATARKRGELDLFGEGGLEAFIKPIIEKVMREIINRLFKNGGFAQLLSNQAASGLGELLGERTSSGSAASGDNQPQSKGQKTRAKAKAATRVLWLLLRPRMAVMMFPWLRPRARARARATDVPQAAPEMDVGGGALAAPAMAAPRSGLGRPHCRL